MVVKRETVVAGKDSGSGCKVGTLSAAQRVALVHAGAPGLGAEVLSELLDRLGA